MRISDWSSDVCSSDLADAVEQPVGKRLRTDAQRRAIFHQTDVVDVGDLRTADALVDPAHDIAQYALAIIVELARDLRLGPVAARRDGNGQQARQRRHRLARELQLPRKDVDGILVEGDQTR